MGGEDADFLRREVGTEQAAELLFLVGQQRAEAGDKPGVEAVVQAVDEGIEVVPYQQPFGAFARMRQGGEAAEQVLILHRGLPGHEAYQSQLLQEGAAQQVVVVGRDRGRDRRGGRCLGQEAVEGLDAFFGLYQTGAATTQVVEGRPAREQQEQQRAQQPELHPLAVHQQAQVGGGKVVARMVFLADGAVQGVEGIVHGVIVTHQVEVVEGARAGVVDEALQVAQLVLGRHELPMPAVVVRLSFVQIILGRVQKPQLQEALAQREAGDVQHVRPVGQGHQAVEQSDGRGIVGRDVNHHLGVVAQIVDGPGGVAALHGHLHAAVGVPCGRVGLHQTQGDAQREVIVGTLAQRQGRTVGSGGAGIILVCIDVTLALLRQ